MIKGKKVGLRSIEEDDLKKLLDWRNNPDYRQYFREYRELNMTQQKKWYSSKVVEDNSTIMFCIINLKTSELIGVCGLCYINWINGTADLSLYIGKDNCYIDKEGFAHETCELLFYYAFEELRLNRIWTEIYVTDKKKIELYKRLGMSIDGTLRENYFHDGQYLDSYIFSILKREFAYTK